MEMLSVKEPIDTDLLDEIDDFLDNYADCEGNSPADWHPNVALSLMSRLRYERGK